MRVAIVHHWFVTQGGGERVAEVLAGMFPEADIFTLLWDPAGLPSGLGGRRVTTSFLQHIPLARRAHRHMMVLYPLAVEQLDLSAYDLVITSDSGPMKGVITRPDAVQICYCHSPMRYLWDGFHSYVRSMHPLIRAPFSLGAHYVRNWDYLAAQRVTMFLANSAYVASRILHYYGRSSTVIHPPIDTGRGFIADAPGDYYLAVGRLVGYKRTDLLIDACNRRRCRLKIVGVGPELSRLQAMAGPTIEFCGSLEVDALWQAYAHCRALLFAAEEDFGMVPLEAQACGRPVIAYGRGGALETVRPLSPERGLDDVGNVATGVFFGDQTAQSVVAAMEFFEAEEGRFSSSSIQQHARQFDTAEFIRRIAEVLAPWYRPNED